MNLLKEFHLEDRCSYLQEKKQTTHYKIIDNCALQSSESLIQRGFRRFGKMYFRPICPDCNECKSIKIDAKNYVFSKSARRIIRKANAIRQYLQKPTLTKEHLKLFEKYHLYMSEKKGWQYSQTSPDHYYNSFVMGHEDFGYEVLYFDEDKLIAVDLIDILQEGISSIYFYYDPQYAKFSLGKLSLYQQILFAQNTQRRWIYLGYYVKDCPSLAYKAQYKPYLTLKGRPGEYEEAIWS